MQTLPVGPVEVGKLWYARSRLAVNQCAFFVWGAGQPAEGRWVIMTTRIHEKPFELTAALLWELLERIDLSSTEQLKWWSDTGPHYRTYKLLGTVLLIMEGYKIWFIINFG